MPRVVIYRIKPSVTGERIRRRLEKRLGTGVVHEVQVEGGSVTVVADAAVEAVVGAMKESWNAALISGDAAWEEQPMPQTNESISKDSFLVGKKDSPKADDTEIGLRDRLFTPEPTFSLFSDPMEVQQEPSPKPMIKEKTVLFMEYVKKQTAVLPDTVRFKRTMQNSELEAAWRDIRSVQHRILKRQLRGRNKARKEG